MSKNVKQETRSKTSVCTGQKQKTVFAKNDRPNQLFSITNMLVGVSQTMFSVFVQRTQTSCNTFHVFALCFAFFDVCVRSVLDQGTWERDFPC